MGELSPKNGQVETDESSFSSSHTSNFPDLLRSLGISLLVSTYQAGKLIVLRAEGDRVNTHFCEFSSPMGLAWDPPTGCLALGTRNEVWHFRNLPAVAAKLPPPGRHDAAFLPRYRHYTGQIQIHEVAWAGAELWAVNTRFSCLCTFDEEHSFVPRWQPPFITALAPEDRCHLNGLAVADGEPRYVSCLGLTDTKDGWRPAKASGGAVIDVPSGEIVLRDLSMPHSPRVEAGRPWILESGRGTLSTWDPAAGRAEVVTRLPGFTRGLDFAGDVAFVGLSQVRETAVFSNLPIMAEVPERACGVWAVDLRTGRTLASFASKARSRRSSPCRC